jgi:hypothetical protein
MSGYACHLERIDAAVFDPHRAFYTDRLGFCPSDTVRLVRRHVAHTNRHFNASRSAIFSMFQTSTDDAAMAQAVRTWQGALEMSYLWSADAIADSTGLDRSEVAALLDHLSESFGCQPDFRTPFDSNAARTRPIVMLDATNFFVPLPWTVAHNVHAFMQRAALTDSAFAARYQKHRSDGAERLLHEGLEGIFGATHTHARQHFVAHAGPGEIDSLVAGARTVIAEAKSHALTEPGRRGHRPRIERVADDTVESGLTQTARAAHYILSEHGRSFAARQGGDLVDRLPPEVESCLEIVVTLERMDPIATNSLRLSNRARPAWVTSLADFLMVIDILDNPATLLDYVERRATAVSVGIEIIMESDALEGYLNDRLSSIIDTARASGDDTSVMLGYGSTAINAYFTEVELGIDHTKPNRGIPEPALHALAATFDDTLGWSRVAHSVVTADLNIWKTWRKFVRRRRTRSFVLPGTDVTLIAAPETAGARLDGLTLTLPMAEGSHSAR